MTLQNFPLAVIQLLLLLGLSPLLKMTMKKLKAFLQGRHGPPLLQGYYDLIKYFHKDAIISEQASWLFQATPALLFACVLTAGMMVPTIGYIAPLEFLGGIIAMVYLLGLGRFFMAAAALETGSGFCGMASSREMMLAVVTEPVLLLCLFVIALMAGSTDLSVMMQWLSEHHSGFFSPAHVLAVLALLIAGIAEIGRIPFDNPETHYELTMIHEGMLLDYSGKYLGLMLWASWIKQLVVLSLLVNIMLPWGLTALETPLEIVMGLGFYLLKLLLLCIVVELVEISIAKVRLFRVKDVLGGAFVISIICILALIASTQGWDKGGF